MKNQNKSKVRILLAKIAVDPNASERKLSSLVGETRYFVRDVKSQLKELSMNVAEALALPDDAFDAAFPVASRRETFTEPDWNEVWKFMNPSSVKSTARQIPQLGKAWAQYVAQKFGVDPRLLTELPQGCMSESTFIRRFHEYCEDHGKPDVSTAPTLRFKRGELMEIDTIGDRFRYRTPDGQLHLVKIYTAVLKFSGLIFAEATERTTTMDWLRCTADAFSFFGGVPQTVRSDNDAAIVIHGTKGRGMARLQPAYAALLHDYGTGYDLAPVRRPTYKGSVERANGILIQELFSEYTGSVVTASSLEDYNRKLRSEVERVNQRARGKSGISRRACFELYEKDSLQRLPDPLPIMREIKLVKVNADGYVRYGRHYYFAGFKRRCEEVLLEMIGGTQLKIRAGNDIVSAKTVAAYEICHEYSPTPLRFKADNLQSADEKAVARTKEWYTNYLEEYAPSAVNIRLLLDSLWGESKSDNPIATKRSNALCLLIRKASGVPEGMEALDRACALAVRQDRSEDFVYITGLLNSFMKLIEAGVTLNEVGKTQPRRPQEQTTENVRGGAYYEKLCK